MLPVERGEVGPSESREIPRLIFASAICDFLTGTPGGDVREDVRAMGAMVGGMEKGKEGKRGW